MTKINRNKIAFILESQGIVVVVLKIKNFYSIRCGWSCDNTCRGLMAVEKRAREMLEEAVRERKERAARVELISDLVSRI